MAAETPRRKLAFAIQAAIWTLFFLMCGAVYLARAVNVSKIDSKFCDDLAITKEIKDACDYANGNYYDVMFFEGTWKDDNKAAELILEVQDWDNRAKGSRFSVIYAFCGVTFILLTATNISLAFGAYFLTARLAGLCCGCCLGCINFFALIVTATFRFNKMG